MGRMMGWSGLTDALMSHGGIVVLPLAVIEGPVVSVIVGMLCAGGRLGVWPSLAMLVGGDVLGDLLYYGLGRWAVSRPRGLTPGWVRARIARQADRLAGLQDGLRRDATSMLLIGKWTHAIGMLVLIGAGMVRLDLRRFLLVNVLATVPKSALLFGLGYFAFSSWLLPTRDAAAATGLLFVIGAGAVLLLLRRRFGRLAGWPR